MAEPATHASEAQLRSHREQFLSALPGRLEALQRGLAGLRARPESETNRHAVQRRLEALRDAGRLLRLSDIAHALGTGVTLLESPNPDSATLDELESLMDALCVARPTLPAVSLAELREAEPVAEEPAPPSSEPVPREPQRKTFIFLGPSEVNDDIRISLEPRGLDVVASADVADALRLIAERELCLAVVDSRLPSFEDVVRELSSECVVIGFGDVALMRRAKDAGAAEYAASKLELVALIEKPLSHDDEAEAEPVLPLSALADQLADELRGALVETKEPESRGARLSEHAKDSARAVTWSAIGKLRQVISDASEGDVDYSDQGPEGALMVAPRRRRRERARDASADLRGRRVLVVDDDPAIVWFIGSALRAAGSTVTEACDGLEAWELAKNDAPDLVVSDVMMPKLDGFALCRNLKRDVVLSDVPVVLLSWKEDLLQRVRELGVGADGYVSKESEAETVVERCAEALSVRASLEARIGEGGTIHGRLDGITPRYVLELVQRRGGDAIVEFCDAGFAYEAHFEDGGLIAARRRGADGTEQNGEGALPGLLGMRAGRFIVRQGELSSPNLEGSVQTILDPHIEQIRRALVRVQGAGLQAVARLELDETVVAPYVASSPPVARKLVTKLRDGVRPSTLLQSVTAGLLETVLVDLAIRGAILRALDDRDRDLLAPGASDPAPLDADLTTPEPGLALAPAPGAPKLGPDSTSADVERAVVFADRLRESRARHEELGGGAREPEEPQKPKAEAGPASSSSSSAPPSSSSSPAPPSSGPSPAPFKALNARIEAMFGDEEQALDLSQAVLAGMSLSPPPPAERAERAERAETQATNAPRTARTPTPPPIRISPAPASSPVAATPHPRQATARARCAPRVVVTERTPAPSVQPQKTPAPANPVAATDAAEAPTPTPVSVQTNKPLRVARKLTTGSLVPSLTTLVKCVDAARQGASSLMTRSEAWLKKASEAAEPDETSAPPPLTEPLKTPRSPSPLPVKAEPQPTHTKASPEPKTDPREDSQALPVRNAPPPSSPPGDSEPDTDPDWVPPVDGDDLSSAIPLQRRALETLWMKRVAVPVVLVLVGGYGAFSLVGALSSALPQELTANVQVQAQASAQPEALASSQPEPETPDLPVPDDPNESAAQALLEKAKAGEPIGGHTVRDEEEASADSGELISHQLDLPKNVTLTEGKGLLELVTGDKHKLYVEGVFVGRGPARRVPVAPGTHTVKLRLGGKEREYSVEVAAGKRTRLEPAQKTAERAE